MAKYIPPHKRSDYDVPGRNTMETMQYVVSVLDDLAEKSKVDQTTFLDRCDVCYDRVIGHFDQSKLQFVPGHLWKLLNLPQRIQIIPGNLGKDPSLRAVVGNCRYGCYELRQLIARSGVYRRDQLKGLKFTEHELSVAEASYLAARSEYKECSCNGLGYGLVNPDRVMEDTPYLISAGLPDFADDPELAMALAESLRDSHSFREETDNTALTKVEQAFLKGRSIPTGRRVRSREARERRRLKSSPPPPIKVVECYPHVPRGVKVSEDLLPSKGVLITLAIPKVFLRKFKRRKPKARVIPGSGLPPKGKSKYWYFFRTRGKWNYSLHHPTQGDPVNRIWTLNPK
jgi:hypothetical protein